MSKWLEITSVEQIPVMGARVVETGDLSIAIFRGKGDTVYAIKDACPHKNGPLSQGIMHGTSVTCPLHNWKISLTTGEALAPDEGCAHVFPAKTQDGKVYIQITKK